MPSVRSLLKSFERRYLRSAGRKVRKQIHRLLGDGDRVERLEARVEALESLVRELTGLAYLRLDDDAAKASTAADDSNSPRPPREAA